MSAELDQRITRVERKVEDHDVEIKLLDRMAKDAAENMGINKGMLQALHKRMDKNDETALTALHVKEAIETHVPPMVDSAMERSIGKFATKIIFWIAGTTAFVVLTSAVKDYIS